MSRLFIKTKTKSKTSTAKTKTLFFVLEAPRDQDFGLEDYITELGWENIMKIRLQYIQKYTIFFVLTNDITWEAPRYPSEPPWRRKELCVDISISKEGNKKQNEEIIAAVANEKNR